MAAHNYMNSSGLMMQPGQLMQVMPVQHTPAGVIMQPQQGVMLQDPRALATPMNIIEMQTALGTVLCVPNGGNIQIPLYTEVRRMAYVTNICVAAKNLTIGTAQMMKTSLQSKLATQPLNQGDLYKMGMNLLSGTKVTVQNMTLETFTRHILSCLLNTHIVELIMCGTASQNQETIKNVFSVLSGFVPGVQALLQMIIMNAVSSNFLSVLISWIHNYVIDMLKLLGVAV